jgi:solute carrier family 25 phosphate transporter 23/24/25/41
MFLNDMVIGGIAGVISRTMTAPLELLKIQNQNRFIPNTTLKEVIQKEGIKGLWKGNLVNNIRIFPQNSINFAVFEYFKNHLFNSISNCNLKNFLSGTTSGIIALTIIYPLENIRSRLSLQTHKNHYNGILDVFKKTPIRQLYNGLWMSILGYAPYNAFNFMFYNFFKKEAQKRDLHGLPFQLASGGLSGSLAVSLTYPSDLIRRRLQLQGFDNLVPKYNGIIDCIKKIYINEGIQGFYRGLMACYIKIFPAISIQFFVYENLKKITK